MDLHAAKALLALCSRTKYVLDGVCASMAVASVPLVVKTPRIAVPQKNAHGTRLVTCALAQACV